MINRRQALKTIGAGVALTGIAAIAGRALAADPAPMPAPPAPPSPWELPKLAFGYDALEPHIDALTMQIHHSKHHQAYITNAKKILESQPEWRNRTPEFLVTNIESVPEVIRAVWRRRPGNAKVVSTTSAVPVSVLIVPVSPT